MLNAPWRINVDTNPDDCNLSCIMCELHSPYAAPGKRPAVLRRRMYPRIFRALFEELRGTAFQEVVATSMGEPLLYEYMPEIVELCGRDGIRLSLTTNGTFPRGGARYWADRLTEIGADIKISLNAATSDTLARIMKGADLDRILENIRTLVAVRDARARTGGRRSRITLKVTFLECNVRQLPDFVLLAADLGVDRLRGSHLLSIFPETEQFSVKRTPEARALFNEMIGKTHAAGQSIAAQRDIAIELSNFVPLTATLRRGLCPYVGNEAWIDAEGGFAPCCLPESLRRRLGTFGNVTESGLLPLWRGPAYREFCASYQSHAICSECEKRRVDLREDRPRDRLVQISL